MTNENNTRLLKLDVKFLTLLFSIIVHYICRRTPIAFGTGQGRALLTGRTEDENVRAAINLVHSYAFKTNDIVNCITQYTETIYRYRLTFCYGPKLRVKSS